MRNACYDDMEFTEGGLLNVVFPAEFDNCTFNNLDFAGNDFSGCWFTDCNFNHCNLSLVPLGRTAFKNVNFNQCKMLGLRFDDCDPFLFAINITQGNAGQCSFAGVKISGVHFTDTDFSGADFTNTHATSSVWHGCNFDGAVFENANLQKADFSRAYNYTIDPENNKLAQAVFSLQGVGGLLAKHRINIVP